VKCHPTIATCAFLKKDVPELHSYVEDPRNYLTELAKFIFSADEFRKGRTELFYEDVMKDLLTRMIYGGGIKNWQKDHDLLLDNNNVNDKEGVYYKLSTDCKKIRNTIFEKNQNLTECLQEHKPLHDENSIKNRTASYWFQIIENHILYVAFDWLLSNDYIQTIEVLDNVEFVNVDLEYDGLFFKPTKPVDNRVIEELNKHIETKTGFKVRFIKKGFREDKIQHELIESLNLDDEIDDLPLERQLNIRNNEDDDGPNFATEEKTNYDDDDDDDDDDEDEDGESNRLRRETEGFDNGDAVIITDINNAADNCSEITLKIKEMVTADRIDVHELLNYSVAFYENLYKHQMTIHGYINLLSKSDKLNNWIFNSQEKKWYCFCAVEERSFGKRGFRSMEEFVEDDKTKNNRWIQGEYRINDKITTILPILIENKYGKAIPLLCKKIEETCRSLTADNQKGLRDKLNNIKNRIYKFYMNQMRLLENFEYKTRIRSSLEDRMSSTRDQEFDMNPFLIGFNNGVFDLDTFTFRPQEASDYVLMTCGYDFVPLIEGMIVERYVRDDKGKITKHRRTMKQSNSPLVERRNMDALNNFIESILPEEDKRKYFLYSISMIVSGKRSEKFLIMNGEGRNGKSKMSFLCKETMGEYAHTISVSQIASSKKGSFESKGNANAELANCHKKRFVLTSEPKKNVAIQNHVIKDMTGNDTLNARLLYSNKSVVTNYMTLVLECNPLPDMSDDCGRAEHDRVDVVTFEVCFVDEKEKNEPEKINNPKFALKKDLPDTWIRNMRNAWMNILIKYFVMFKSMDYQYDRIPRPMCVQQSSREYIQNSDYCAEIFNYYFEYKVEDKNYESHEDITYVVVIDKMKYKVMEEMNREGGRRLIAVDNVPRAKIVSFLDMKFKDVVIRPRNATRKKDVEDNSVIPNWRYNAVGRTLNA
jgi:phage/plasmid-associated DNA primase